MDDVHPLGIVSEGREGADDGETLDNIGENCENLKAKVVSYTTDKTEQAQGGDKKMHVPMAANWKKIGKMWVRFEGVDMLQFRDDGTLRDGLYMERQG